MPKPHGRDDVQSQGKRTPLCLCGAKGVRNEEFDAYFCPTSRVWLEDDCGNPACVFCFRRPAFAPADLDAPEA